MIKMTKDQNIKLGECPYCKSVEYERLDLEPQDDDIIVKCFCKCRKEFTEYFSIDEVKFDKEGEEFIFNNALCKDEKETLLKALNLLIESECDTTDYTRIINVLSGGLNEES